MSEFITFMGAPLAACFLLSIVYTYFGCHVLKREIIFIDLSLAQLAALGTTVAFAWEMDLDSPGSLGLSLIFILLGAGFFAFTRFFSSRVPQEAIIGIVYVVGASTALLLAGGMPHGAEHLKTLLNGSILWITWGGVLKIFCVILPVGVFHWVWRGKMLEQSQSYQTPSSMSSKGVAWDFLFYLTLGLVIVFSVRTAGVFLIFTFLIIPAVCGAFFSSSIVSQFIIGSAIGVLVSFTGLVLAFFLDLPTGAAIVCSFGVIFIFSLLASRFKLPMRNT